MKKSSHPTNETWSEAGIRGKTVSAMALIASRSHSTNWSNSLRRAQTISITIQMLVKSIRKWKRRQTLRKCKVSKKQRRTIGASFTRIALMETVSRYPINHRRISNGTLLLITQIALAWRLTTIAFWNLEGGMQLQRLSSQDIAVELLTNKVNNLHITKTRKHLWLSAKSTDSRHTRSKRTAG